MKTLLAVFLSTFLAVTSIYAAETKTVCVDKTNKDGTKMVDKAGKPIQECREIKVHKKLEGTPVPEKGK